MTVLPRSGGTFLMSRSEISLKDAAVSRMLVISPADTPSSPSRCRCVNAMLTSSPFDHNLVHAVRLGEPDLHLLAARRGNVLADVVGADRELAVTAVDENRELDRLRPPEVDERVHGGADGPAGEEHVVDQEDPFPLDGERDVGAVDHRVLEAPVEVVAVERDVDHAERNRRSGLDLVDGLADALREVHAARADADQRQTVGTFVVLEDLVRDADEGSLDTERIHHLAGTVGAHQRTPDAKKPPRLSRGACSGATEIVAVMREPFLTSLGQVKRCRPASGVDPNYAASERLSRLRPVLLPESRFRNHATNAPRSPTKPMPSSPIMSARGRVRARMHREPCLPRAAPH